MAFRAAPVHLVARAREAVLASQPQGSSSAPSLDSTQAPSQSAHGESNAALGQLAFGARTPCVPITFGGGVPVLVSQERVGAVSQAVGAAARRLVALHALAHEMHPLAVAVRDE